MVTEYEAYFIKEVEIPCETNNINFEAREIGAMQMMLEKETDDDLKQWFNFFLLVAEQELENANERLTKYRKKLVDFNEQQRLIQPV